MQEASRRQDKVTTLVHRSETPLALQDGFLEGLGLILSGKTDVVDCSRRSVRVQQNAIGLECGPFSRGIQANDSLADAVPSFVLLGLSRDAPLVESSEDALELLDNRLLELWNQSTSTSQCELEAEHPQSCIFAARQS